MKFSNTSRNFKTNYSNSYRFKSMGIEFPSIKSMRIQFQLIQFDENSILINSIRWELNSHLIDLATSLSRAWDSQTTNLLASTSLNKIIVVWSSATHSLLHRLVEHSEGVSYLAWSYDSHSSAPPLTTAPSASGTDAPHLRWLWVEDLPWVQIRRRCREWEWYL